MASDALIIDGEVEFWREPNKTWHIMGDDAGRVIGDEDKLTVLRQAIWAMVCTERYSNPIYSKDYGTELQQYIGKDAYFLEASIEDTLRDALTHDDRIKNVSVEDVTQTDINSVLVRYSVESIYGAFKEELKVRV